MACLTLSLAACDDTPPPPAAPGFDAATAQQLFERLDRLVGALEAMPRASGVAVPVEAVAERTPVTDATLVARLEALEREVALLRAHGGSTFAPARQIPAPVIQTNTVQRVWGQLQSEDNALQQEARRSLFLLTQQQVLERFGMPSNVNLNDASTNWSWIVDSENELSITFVNGLAIQIH